jgi:vancomycin aglycone glucosyltransferase
MRVLLSTIGSRGEIQPLTALALQLRAFGQEVRVCAPPDFRDWFAEFGIPHVPIGPEVRGTAKSSPGGTMAKLSPEQLDQLRNGTVATQLATIGEAARGCDLVVGCGALQIAANSVAEGLGIPYVFVAYSPNTLPSPHHAPPVYGLLGDTPATGETDNRTLWARDAQRLNDGFGAALNAHRASAGLAPVSDVRGHIFTERPLLAADPTLGPWPGSADLDVVQTGAWMLPDWRLLPAELESFLDTGDPPVYFGLGSMRAPDDISQMMVKAARELGRRVIVSEGWADLSLVDDGPDCVVVGEVNHQALFRRVAAAVHHGGAGTTTAAAYAGAPQVVLPQLYDQHYWARRVDELGIGIAHQPGAPTTGSLAAALSRALEPGLAAQARSVAASVRCDGAQVAAQFLIS